MLTVELRLPQKLFVAEHRQNTPMRLSMSYKTIEETRLVIFRVRDDAVAVDVLDLHVRTIKCEQRKAVHPLVVSRLPLAKGVLPELMNRAPQNFKHGVLVSG